ncbi:MAG: fumarate hydratase, partial [Longimicrobiales bacterium]
MPETATGAKPAAPEFVYQDPFPTGADTTEYRKIEGSERYVRVEQFDGQDVLRIDPEALTVLAREAMRDVSFLLRPSHNQQVAQILDDPEASDNDRGVALAFLRNAEVSADGVLPVCQDTGTATVVAKKGQRVWTGVKDEEALSEGIYQTYTGENLRYSQTVPLDMYTEKNSGTNLPAQIDIAATPGDEYKFLFMAKGGGSANKTMLYQKTKALLNPETLEAFLVDRMKSLGTAACPPYHIAFVIGGTSADAVMKVVKLATARELDGLPTTGNEHGRAFRDIKLESKLLEAAQELGIGAQFGGKYFAHDVRVVRLPRHGASCPVGMAVSCSADRNLKARITRDGLFLEALDRDPGRLIPAEYREGDAAHGHPIDLDRPMEDVLA